MTKEIINTNSAPAPIGPYSQAVKINGLIFVSGQVALDAASGDMINNNIAEETTQILKNIEAILAESGAGFANIVKTTIFLSDMNLFSQVNEIYAGFFDNNFPARETVAVKGLPKNANVEISVIAAVS